MVQKLSDTLVRQIDTHDPFMQIHKIGQKYNDLVDRYNDLEAELEAIKNPTEDQQTDEIPADNDGILNDTATDNQNTDESEADTPATDGTDDESEQNVDGSTEVADSDDEEKDAE